MLKGYDHSLVNFQITFSPYKLDSQNKKLYIYIYIYKIKNTFSFAKKERLIIAQSAYDEANIPLSGFKPKILNMSNIKENNIRAKKFKL